MESTRTDVLVIGGGPAGTTFSILIKDHGWDVTLLEKEKHPRFHIGESLLPMNLPILDRLGVLESVKAVGVPKLGADFTIGNSEDEQQTFYFKEALGNCPESAFEVRRSEFDRILFDQCKARGVRTHEQTLVQDIELLNDGTHRVIALGADGVERQWVTRFLVDASGRDTFLSSKNKWKARNRKHASAAIYGHFRGVTRRPGQDQGNISLYWFDHGWIWMIPLAGDIMSVGAVCNPAFLKTRSGTLDNFLHRILQDVSQTKERMKGAEAALPAQAAGNYSYTSKRMFGPGFLIIGDAFAFIDPVFSSGVYLAMHGAERSVSVAQEWLDGNKKKYSKACRRYRREVLRGLSVFSWFIYRFTSPVMSNLMRKPRNSFQVVQAVISMLAGDVFSNRAVRRRLLIFKSIYSVSWLFNWRHALAARKIRQAGIRATRS